MLIGDCLGLCVFGQKILEQMNETTSIQTP